MTKRLFLVSSICFTLAAQITPVPSGRTGVDSIRLTRAPLRTRTLNQSPVSDDFAGGKLKPMWKFLNPAGGSYAMQASNQVKLIVPGGSNHDPSFGGMDNSVRIVQQIGVSDFTVTVRFNEIPSLKYQFEGITVVADATNYLRFQFGSNGAGLEANTGIIANGVETSAVSAQVNRGTAKSIWMRVVHSGTRWTQLYSLTGSNYVMVGSFDKTLAMTAIGPFGGNYGDGTTAPAYNAWVGNFIAGPPIVFPPPLPPPPPPTGTCTATPNVQPGTDFAAAVNASTASPLVFSAGTYHVARETQLKPDTTYCTSGKVILQGDDGYALVGLRGNNVTFTGFEMVGGGVHINGGADNMHLSRLNIHDIHNTVTTFGPEITGIFQDRANGQQISNSSIDHSRLWNIYAPGQLSCDGQYPAQGGQPCDWLHDGIDLYNISNTTIQYNTTDTISGDAIHAFQEISCGQLGAPRVPQPGNSIMYNLIRSNHRIPLEIQLCGLSGFKMDYNVLTHTFIPNAWDIAISLASECTGCEMVGNYIDGANSDGPSWGIPGTCFETGGTGTKVDSNFCSSSTGSSGYSYYGVFSLVMGSGESFTNNTLCGPFQASIIIWEPPCISGAGCAPFTQSGNTVSPSCAGFPPLPTNAGADAVVSRPKGGKQKQK